MGSESGRRHSWRTPGVVALTAAALAAFAALPLAASGTSEKRVVIGLNEHFTGPNSAAGTFIAAGAISDSGARTETFTITPSKAGTEATIEGTVNMVGSLGTITEAFSGTLAPLGEPRVFVDGHFEFTGGTGAYAGLRGSGKFLGVADLTTNTVIGTDAGDAKLKG
jgi:hypothetical protein